MTSKGFCSGLRHAGLIGAAVFMAAAVFAAEKPSGDTTVYWWPGKKRVHVIGCRRLTKDPAELAKMTKMTLAEAEAKGLPLCSRCPGSTTPGKGRPQGPESWVNPPPARSAGQWRPPKQAFRPSKRAPLVSLGKDGKLVYKPYTDQGDRLLDFSYCGYKRSEAPIPSVPAVETLSPPDGEATPEGNMAHATGPDSFARIQAALDKVAARRADADGFRGAVLLRKGTWYVEGSLLVQSGVVLRGEGDGPDGTVLIFTLPSGTETGVQLGGNRPGSSSETFTPVTGTLSREKAVNGDEAYVLTLDDGYRFIVGDPKFKPELKLQPYVGSRVTLTMKVIATTDGDKTRLRLKHNMPYEAARVEAGQAVPPLDPNLVLPAAAFGSGNVPESKIADDYVPSGSTQLTLADANGFKVGDAVDVVKTTNKKWIEVLGVGERLRHIRGGKEGAFKKPWGPQGYHHLRRITAVNGNAITLDVPLPQSIETQYGGGFVRKVEPSTADAQCGVEYLRVVSNYDTTVEDRSKSSNFRNLKNGIGMSCVNGWARHCTVMHVWENAVGMGGAQYCTVRDCQSLEPVGPKRGGRRYPFSISGSTGILVYGCYSVDGRHDFVVGARTMGPNVFLKCTALRGGQSEPHHRWGVGTLYDNITLKGSGNLAAINSGDSGTGHGWAAANTVFWNCAAENIVVFDPETTGENNFAIGYTGPKKDAYGVGGLWYANTRSGYWGTPAEGAYYGYALMGSGYIESPDKPVKPASLFEQQLIDRIGKAKAKAVLQ